VFSEFASELQRSLNYFTGADRTATVGKVLLLGNATKLRGLSDFVAKQLQLDVQRLEKFDRMDGPTVLGAPAFRENRLAFGTAYGLALQAAAGSFLQTNLLPKEIVVDRLIEAKKPWALAALVGLFAAAALNFAGIFFAWSTYAPRLYAAAFAKADAVKSASQAASAALEEVRAKRTEAAAQQRYLVDVQNRRFQTLDMLRAVESLLPRDPPGKPAPNPADRNELHIESLDMQYFPDLATWFAAAKRQWEETHSVGGTAATPPPASAPPAEGAEPPPAEAAPAQVGPKGPGWVVQITGHHFHNEDRHKPEEGEQFLRSSLVQALLGNGDEVLVSAGPWGGRRVPVTELGIGYPIIMESPKVQKVQIQRAKPTATATGGPAAPADAETIELKRYDFTLQFAWQPTTPGIPKPPPPPEPAAQ